MPRLKKMARETIQKEIAHLVDLLKLEKDAELEIYLSGLQNHSLAEQRRLGVCWYPVRLEKMSFDTGERLLIKVSRMPEHKQEHQFKSGKPVRLFSNAENNIDENFITAVVNNANDSEMIITINAEDWPDWIHKTHLGIQLLFDENAFTEMEKALNYLYETKEENVNRLKNVLLGHEEARFYEEHQPVELPALNTTQNEALNKCLSALDVAIIHGPPGTGKTTTLVQSIIELLKQESQVLVTAPSNAAVDLLVEKLSEQNIVVVRIGHPARVTEAVLKNTLDARITSHESYKDLRAIRRQSEEYRDMALKYKRNFDEHEREQRKLLLSESKKMRHEANQLAFYISSDVLSRAQVIASTLVGAANNSIKGFRFQTVFIDEASQGMEPACWIPILKAQKVIFAGDHHQLPPTIKSFKAAKNGLETTLFEKAISRNQADVMLTVQYRMNEAIMNFSSKQFYHNKLVAHHSVSQHKLFETDDVVEFVDTAGTGFFEQNHSENHSILNPEEAELIKKHFLAYMEQLEHNNALRELKSIGIISPYRAQTVLLRSLLFQKDVLPPFILDMLTISTVDSFQGQEKDIIYISLVRSNEKNDIGFLADIRRMNVALTRARKKLVVFGDSATLAKHPFYSDFLDYISASASYRSAFEWF